MRSVRRRMEFAWVALVPAINSSGPSVNLLSNSEHQTDIVVVAHQDDWQLFMGDALSERLRFGNHGVFVYLTAGDDGRDSTYWQSRERAALQSTRIAAGLPAGQSFACSTVDVREHPIKKCTLGINESYFLRLPDGKRNGKGFARYGYRSLRKLHASWKSDISAIDASTTYRGWNDLIATVGAIAQLDSPTVTIHTNDPNVARNPHDHFDHRMAGLLVAELRKEHPVLTMYYVGYALATRAANRSPVQTQAKTALLLAYDREMMSTNPKWSAFQEHRAFYSQCMQRTYVARSPVPGIR